MMVQCFHKKIPQIISDLQKFKQIMNEEEMKILMIKMKFA